MAPNKDYLDRVMKLLAPIEGVSSKPMFGGYGLFHESAMFALVSGAGLFFKVDDSNRAAYEQAGSKQYKPMPYYLVPAEVLEHAEKFLEWARAAMAVAHSADKKKR